MIEMSNVFNAQLAEKELFVLFLLLFVLKKEKKNAWGTRGKSLTLPLARKRKKRRR